MPHMCRCGQIQKIGSECKPDDANEKVYIFNDIKKTYTLQIRDFQINGQVTKAFLFRVQ